MSYGKVFARRTGGMLTIVVALPQVGFLSTTGRFENLVDPTEWVTVVNGSESIDLKLVVGRRVRGRSGTRGL